MSAYKNADESGCGLVFAIQPDSSHYAVFLDRSKIIFLDADSSYGTRCEMTNIHNWIPE